MKMKLSWLLIIILLGFVSCKDLVQDEFPDFNAVPTVNSILGAGSPIKVHVSLTGKIDTNQLKLVDDATVMLYIDGVYNETMQSIDDGFYASNSIAEPHKTYRCEVSIPGFETVTCQDSIPEIPMLYDIIHINKAGKDEEGVSYPAIKFSFSNNPSEKQYFEVVIRLITSRYEYFATLQTITDPVLLNEGLPLTTFSNEFIKDTSYTMTINYTTGGVGSSGNGGLQTILSPMIIEFRSVSYSYYQYVRQLFLYDKGRYPDFMAGSITAFPLYSDVEGGYGIFAGYTSVQSDTLFPHY